MIKSFADKRSQSVFEGKTVKGIDPILLKKTRRRLEYLHAATKLEDLYFPPSNKFHALQGHNPTRYAIWVNQQWRVTFSWEEGHATEVKLEDYH